jgi:hypothetical protein
MNNLSWLLYLADVLPKFHYSLFIMSIIAAVGTTFFFFLGSTNCFGDLRDDHPTVLRLRKLYWGPPFFIALALLSALIPSNRNTYYAIAASELGEQVLKSPTTNKTIKALDTWLDKQINTYGDEEKTTKRNNSDES